VKKLRQINFGEGSFPISSESLASHLFSKNLKIKIKKTIILADVLYGC
jgi:hypothetical protein